MDEATSPKATTAAAQRDSLLPASPSIDAANAANAVTFSVRVPSRHLKSHDGDDVGVYLLGSAAQVGAWDVDKAVSMECAHRDDAETEWRVQVAFPMEKDLPLEYKYVLKQSASLEVLSWEVIPGNRTMTIARGANVARDRPSSLSSTHSSARMPCPGPRAASLGNNGSHNGFQEWRCARTLKEAHPWWEVDLGSEQSITSVQLWKATTYHEHPKHPEGQPPINSTASTGSPSPPLWLIVSSSPLGSNGEEALRSAQSSSTIVARLIALHHNSRMESVQFAHADESSAVVGRYVRLQHESASSSVLQFAELEVFAPVGESNLGVVLQHDDGFYGVGSALDGDSHEFIDSEWLKPSSSLAQVRFWIGSYNEKLPAVQWLQADDEASARRDAVSIKLQYHQRQVDGGSWKPIHVDARSSVLLDKESTELVADIEAFKEQGKPDLSGYLNNDSSASSTRVVSPTSQSPSWFLQFDWVKAIRPEIAEKLLIKIETKTFPKGSSILAYGERKREVFFLSEGKIEVLGPQTSLGAKSIGELERGAIFNELSLFGAWPETITELKATEGSATCEFLSLDSLIQVLGAEQVASIRAQFIRNGSRSFTSKQIADGPADADKVVHFTDSTHVQVFRTKVPLNTLASTDASANPTALSHRFELEIYEYAKDTKKQGAKIGCVHLLPSQLSAHGEGYLTLPIHSSSQGGGGNVIGQLSLTFLVIKPFVHPTNNLSNVWRSYWRPRTPLNVGHRGMGRSYHQVREFRHALTRENTLASFILAGRSGADFVEFDVQLTKDRVPVLYHDFVLNVGLEDKNAWTHGSKAEEFEIGIHEMTLRQLQRSQTTPTSRVKGKNKLQQRVRKHLTQILASKGQAKKNSESLALKRKHDNSVVAADEDHLVEFFPKLEDLFKHVPAEVGLNVEIKYPDNVWRTAFRLSSPFALNEYVDTILKCVFEHAGHNRRIFFSCFDANLCVLLRAKQATYPVFFLTYGSILPHAFDARLTLQFAVNLVGMERLGGIVSNSDAFITNPELVQIVKKKAATKKSVGGPVTPAVLLTWGDKNTGHEVVQLQKQAAMDGVISDNTGDLVRQDVKLFSKQEQQVKQ
ncbi:Glycerophosphodiester phosphodiesterase gde1 [Globisporangium polare]